MLERIRSQRIAHLVQSEIRAMTRACTAVGGVNMGQGICDVPAPDLVKQAAHDAIDADTSIYTRYDGLAQLRGALSERLLRDNGVAYDPETEIVATIGASGALTSTMIALCDPGDEIDDPQVKPRGDDAGRRTGVAVGQQGLQHRAPIHRRAG